MHHMRKLTAVLTLALMVSLPWIGFSQSTGAHVNVSAAATVGRSRAPQQGIHLDNWVDIVARHPDGTVFARRHVHNLVTNAGFDLISKAVSDTATQPAACNYVAVTNTAITPAAGDTTLSGEISSNGLSRAIGTFAHTNGTYTYTVTKIFTATGTQASQASGLFNAASTGSMCYEATYTQVTVNNGDTLTVTWTITLS
jgi:hypothetical protein